MLKKFKAHKHGRHFFLYATAFLIYGICINSLGSFIPYLSSTTKMPETYYSYFFICRSFGMLAGAFICKYLQKRSVANHRMMILGLLSICGFSILFTSTTSSIWLGIWLFLMGAAYSLLQIILNVCILHINDNPEEIEFWMLITHGMFGLGGLIGPFIVSLFETKVFAFLGILIGAISIFCFLIETP